MNGFVIGNGPSRKHFDLNKLKGKGVVYGCNALYRDFHPDVLVSTDMRIAQEVIESGYDGRFIYCDHGNTQKYDYLMVPYDGDATAPMDNNRWRRAFNLGFRWYASGQMALWLMLRQHPDLENIYILGFDFDHTNVYAETACYEGRGHDPQKTNAKRWFEDTTEIFNEFPRRVYYHVGGSPTPREWAHIDVHSIDYNIFGYLLNKEET